MLELALMYPQAAQAAGATLSFSPTQGEYLVGSTFDVSVIVNTNGQAINAVEAFLTFPADLLQVVSPSVGKSFIEIWVAGPSYSNTAGTITFQGGLPSPGATTSAGIISTITFRVKAAGKASLKFEDRSRVFANDGLGSDVLTAKTEAQYTLKTTPPSGPVVSSTSHEDQNRWYNNRTVNLIWDSPGDSHEFSYVLDSNPGTVPHEQTDTKDNHVTKEVDGDGVWFFHIRAKNQFWGGTTHFIIRVDTTPPAQFTPHLDQNILHVDSRNIVTFDTTDGASGIDHYEVRVIDRNNKDNQATLFTEQRSPYQLPQATAGKYSIVVRAFDKAGNATNGTANFEVVGKAVPIVQQNLIFNYGLLLGSLLLLIATLLYWWRRSIKQHVAQRLTNDTKMVDHEIDEHKKELQDLISAKDSIHPGQPSEQDNHWPPTSPR